MTYRQLADVADRVSGRQLRRVERTVPQLEAELAEDPENALKKYRLAFAQGRGVSWHPSRTFNDQRGLRLTTVEQWAREHVAR